MTCRKQAHTDSSKIIPSLSKGPINPWSNNSLYSFPRKCHQVCLLEASDTHDFNLSSLLGFFKCSWNGLCNHTSGLPWWLSSKEYTCNTGDLGSIPELGRSPGEGKGYPLQCSGLENPMDCIVHGITKELDMTEQLNKNSSSKITHLRSAHFPVKVPWTGASILGTEPALCYPPLSCLGCNSCSFPSFTGKMGPTNREGWKKPLERRGFAFYHLLTGNRSRGFLLVLITLPLSIPTRILWLSDLRQVLSPLVIQFQPWKWRCCWCSVAKSCLTLCELVDCSQVPLSFPIPQSLLRFMSIESVMPCNHLIFLCPLLLLPSVFSSIRVFSSESVLCIRWPKYWSFSVSISPSKEYSEYEDNQSISKYILIFTNTSEALSGYVSHPEWEQLSCGLWSEFFPSPATGTWTQPKLLFYLLCSSQGSLQKQIIVMVNVSTFFKC